MASESKSLQRNLEPIVMQWSLIQKRHMWIRGPVWKRVNVADLRVFARVALGCHLRIWIWRGLSPSPEQKTVARYAKTLCINNMVYADLCLASGSLEIWYMVGNGSLHDWPQ